MTDQVVDPDRPEPGQDPGSASAAPESDSADPSPDALAAELAVESAAADEEELAAEAAIASVVEPVLVPIPPERVIEPHSPAVAAEIAVETAGAAQTELAAEAAVAGAASTPVILKPLGPGSTAEDPAGVAAAPARRVRSSRPLRFVGGFAFGLLAVMALSAGGLYAFDLQYSGRILPGVHVGDIDISGLTASQATARLAGEFDSLSTGELVLTAGDLESRTPFADLGRRADIEAMVAQAVSVGRDGTTFQRIVVNAKTAARGLVLERQVVVDRAAVEQAVADFVAYVERRPIDARVDAKDGTLTLVEGTVGRRVDGVALLARAFQAVSPLEVPGRIVVDAAFTPLEPVVMTQEAAAALATANRMAADIVLADIRQSWTIPAAQVRSWITFQTTGDGAHKAVANPTGLDAQLNEMATAILRPPTNASYLIDKSSNVVGASEGKDGRSLDKPGTVAAISALLAQRASGATVASIAPVVTVVKPEITTEQAAATAPLMKKISEWTTYFPIYVNNGFGANIWIPAMDLDGYVIAPGAVFDFWKSIGPVTRARGYQDGGAIINGKTEPQGALAGGICSTSTTLFNAALRAGLKMGARRNHYYYIGRYPIGLDATVFQSNSGSTQTMSFTNDTPNPILIRAYKIKNGTSGYVKFELYGVPTGRTVTIDPEVIKNVKPAVDTRQETDTLPVGTTQRLESPADGKDVWRTVTVRNSGGNILYQTTYYSHYSRVDGVTLVGTAPKT